MTDFQSFRDAVLEDEDLQEQVISIVNTATANGSGLGDGIATDRTPINRAMQDVGFPCIFTLGRSRYEAQALYRREDHLHAQAA